MRTRVDLELPDLATLVAGGTVEMLLGSETVYLGYHGPAFTLPSRQSARRDQKKPRGKYVCEEHAQRFKTPQALGAHRRLAHKKAA